MKDKLKAFDVKIVLYLRRQDDYLQSWYSESVKHGYSGSVESSYSSRKGRFNYSKLVKNWADVFGKDAIVVRDCNSALIAPQGLAGDFLATVGVELSPDDLVLPQSRLVEHWPRSFIALIELVNGYQVPVEKRRELVKLLGRSYSGSPSLRMAAKFELDEDFRKRLMKDCTESNEELAHEFCDGRLLFRQ